jgi:hypothetical protein
MFISVDFNRKGNGTQLLSHRDLPSAKDVGLTARNKPIHHRYESHLRMSDNLPLLSPQRTRNCYQGDASSSSVLLEQAAQTHHNSFSVTKSFRPQKKIPGCTLYSKVPQRYPDPADIIAMQVRKDEWGIEGYNPKAFVKNLIKDQRQTVFK